MIDFRYWLFKKISVFGWWVCPEPHKARLQSKLASWRALEDGK